MKKPLYIGLISMGLTLIVAYVVVVFAFLPKGEQPLVCRALEVSIADSTERQYVQTATLLRLLKEQGLYPVGQPLSEVSTAKIEAAITAYPVVRSAECYKTNGATVRLVVRQRNPKLRVAAEENYFVDEDRQIMPSLASVAAYVPVLTGRVTKRMAQEELYDFVEYIARDGFWNAQIEQIHVTAGRQIELVPRVGGHVILLGTLDGYQRKLHKLETFYKEGLSKTGWPAYREVDLRYKGQVVCRK